MRLNEVDTSDFLLQVTSNKCILNTPPRNLILSKYYINHISAPFSLPKAQYNVSTDCWKKKASQKKLGQEEESP